MFCFPQRTQRKNSGISLENSSGDVLFPTEDTEEEKTTENTEKKLCDFCGEILCDLCGKFSVFSVGNPLCSLWEILCDLCGKLLCLCFVSHRGHRGEKNHREHREKLWNFCGKFSVISVGNSQCSLREISLCSLWETIHTTERYGNEKSKDILFHSYR